ncbi:MAG: hypothetical protein MUF81_06955 [Verrucomicrobia bacterium]|jgi:hypothetical protein|nr:hypothetical protein [Verrucomicrobiota bacterium]
MHRIKISLSKTESAETEQQQKKSMSSHETIVSRPPFLTMKTPPFLLTTAVQNYPWLIFIPAGSPFRLGLFPSAATLRGDV